MSPGQTPVAWASARTLLFVPAHRRERFDKAVASGADAVVIDLEDAVAAVDKPAGRAAIADSWATLRSAGCAVLVRMNAPGSPDAEADLALLASLEGLTGVMVPKAESAEPLAALHGRLGVALLPLVETAAGWLAVQSLAAVRGVCRLAVGHIDFMADTGIACGRDERELDPLRFAVSMATRVHRLAPAIDGVTVLIDDEQRLRDDTLRAVRFGFGGKLCIHPRQVALVHEALHPAASEVAWARRVVEGEAASGGAAFQLDGRMVDLPVVLQARRLLARAAVSSR